jgi:L-iditol 2-dehydrogenase
MRVAVYYNNHDIRIEERPKPEIGPSEILVKVIASGICGSDVMEWYRLKKAPLVLGHEISGEIVEVGEKVKDYQLGQRVFVAHHVPCNNCHYCLSGHHTACPTLHSTNYDPGGFSEYIRVPELNVQSGIFLLPKEISYEEATFIEPLACVIRGQRLAKVQSGQAVLIIGSGISGLLHLLLAEERNASKIIAVDINEFRLQKAKALGADAVVKANAELPDLIRKLNKGYLADVVIVCTGVFSAFAQALQAADRGGTVLFFAPTEPGRELSVPVNDFWRNEMTLLTSYGASPEDIKEAIELLRLGLLPIRDLISHRLSLAETGLGFKLVAEAKDSLKVIIEPQR